MVAATARLIDAFTNAYPRMLALQNALVESFVLHVRVLTEFLYSDAASRKDDGIAADLVRDPAEWVKARG